VASARTDCRITEPNVATRLERGSAEVFLSTYAHTVVAATALLRDIAPPPSLTVYDDRPDDNS
jgi:hypothetical protein